MNTFNIGLVALCTAVLIAGSCVFAATRPLETEFVQGTDIQLPEAQTEGGMPLMEALKNRKTDRFFSNVPLDEQTLSNLLWAANGINRESGKRTAPSAMNYQEIIIFVIKPEGVYAYSPKGHFLKRMLKEDLRSDVGGAPLTLVYAADLSRQNKTNAACDCGFVGQNVYLFAASNGLNTVFKADIKTASIAEKLGLKLGQEIMYGQSVGYPAGIKTNKIERTN